MDVLFPIIVIGVQRTRFFRWKIIHALGKGSQKYRHGKERAGNLQQESQSAWCRAGVRGIDYSNNLIFYLDSITGLEDFKKPFRY